MTAACDSPMRVAVLVRANDQLSLTLYRQNIVGELKAMGVTIVEFAPDGPIPDDCDLVWDSGLGMRRVPPILHSVRLPLVVTCHGARTFSISAREVSPTWADYVRERARKWVVRRQWRRLGRKMPQVITVSQYAATEIVGAFDLPRERVHVIYHGIDRSVFHRADRDETPPRPYLFHVSSGGPKKNVDRLIDAYATLPAEGRPDLVAVLSRPGATVAHSTMPGLRLITTPQTPAQLADLYRGAAALVFPSLHESFGMPIVEAMACGCPVITSNTTACAEIASDAAVLVNPRSTEAIADAMQRLYTDSALATQCVDKGLAHSERFSWADGAREHLDVFRLAVQEQL